MKDLYTISEFSKFRKLNINSLRYYEKIGFLHPAYIDPDTKYRYYRSTRLNQLDVIMMCTNFGIPIKNLRQYIDADGQVAEKALLEDSMETARARIRSAEKDLERIRYMLDFIEENRPYLDKEGIYTRHIRQRLFATADCTGFQHDLKKTELVLYDLYDYCERHALLPMLPSGFMFLYHDGGVSVKIYLECIGEIPGDADTFVIPEGDYQCMQYSFAGRRGTMDSVAADSFDVHDNCIVILTKVLMENLSVRSVRSEVQFLPDMLDQIAGRTKG